MTYGRKIAAAVVLCLIITTTVVAKPYNCIPCKENNYCIKGIRYECPLDKPVTQGNRKTSEDACMTCIQRNGDETNPVYDITRDDCVSCLEYNSETPIWNGATCVACASGTAYNIETGLCESTCPANTVANEAGVCILSKAINECGAGFIGISTAEELAKIGVDEKYPLSGNYCLLNDISLSAYKSGEGWTPIGNVSNMFTGIFDGNGHEISDLYINRPSTYYQGLFALVSGGEIRNLGVVDVDVIGYCQVGGLVGENHDGTITDSYATGSVTGNDKYVGGLVGYNNGTISNSYATGSVTGAYASGVGGLVGQNSDGTITDSYATGSVEGYNTVGGLVGENYNYEGATISNCYATGSVTGTDYVGGLVGQNWNGTITTSYATGSVTGNYVGGLVGWNEFGTISNSYATGSVTGNEKVGGLLGENIEGAITNSYFDTATTGMTVACGVNDSIIGSICSATGKTTAEMQTPSTYSGWDTTIWELVQGQYPKLKGVGGQ